MEEGHQQAGLGRSFVDVLALSCPPDKTILLAGAGGGYDVFSALPLFEELKRKRGRDVALANLTFSDMESHASHPSCATLLPGALWRVAAAPGASSRAEGERGSYFPELYLSEYLEGQAVFVIERAGAAPVRRAYEWLSRELNVGCVVLVDGGTDSLMFGDEEALGTPEEDNVSIAAAAALPAAIPKFLVCLGYGVDAYHGVNHNLFLENVARLVKLSPDAFLGVSSLLPGTPEFQLLKGACDYAFARMQTSIVAGSVVHAVQGDFGDVRFTNRTANSALFINPLMAIFWPFRLHHIAQCNLFVRSPEFLGTETMRQVSAHIRDTRKGLLLRKGSVFPH